mmetsp:Transcript_71038/g.186255  ORF Transcript_71038/g.186255 Transcript_71038/m.186255 type:complete len:223 (-) Transcript_71038:198-866(-)
MAPAASRTEARRPRRSLLAAAALGAVCLNSALEGAFSLTGKAAQPAARAATSRTQMQYNLFELPNFGGEKFDEEEASTRSARVADTANSRLVEVYLPLGINFEERNGGDIYIKDVDPESDAYDQGVRGGAQLVMVSATFGDEMWNAKKVGMTQFMTVLNSRFGSTIQLALEKEDSNFIQSFFASLVPKNSPKADAAKQASMKSVFQQEEEKLREKNFWSPFR